MGNHEMAALLLAGGATLDCLREDGSTPLFKAAHKGHTETCAVLLAKEPYLGILPNGSSALHVATSKQHEDICRMLVEHGADAHLRDRNHSSAFDIARNKKNIVLQELFAYSKTRHDHGCIEVDGHFRDSGIQCD